MVNTEQLLGLLNCENEQTWCARLFALARSLGFDQTLFAMVGDKRAPLETAFLRSNYPQPWRETYDSEKLHYVDPTVAHCLSNNVPLVWSPRIFRSPREKMLYDGACGYGIRSGVTFPVHGADGQFGVASFASSARADNAFHLSMKHFLPSLALIRDYAFESSLRFAKANDDGKCAVRITPREMECLKWTMAGKSSWEISKILNCSESTINFHMANIRRKLGVSTRRQAVVKAIRLGLIVPS